MVKRTPLSAAAAMPSAVCSVMFVVGCADAGQAAPRARTADELALDDVVRATPRALPEERTADGRLLMFGLPGAEGLLDEQGRIIVEPQLAWTRSSTEGLALVERDGKWGFVDGTGRTVIEPTWEDAAPFSEGLAMVASHVERAHRDGLVVEMDARRGYIDRTGALVVAPRFSEASAFSGGVAWVSPTPGTDLGGGCRWGLIDRTGTYLVEPRYRMEPDPFVEGLCAVWEGDEWSTDETVERCAYIDERGSSAFPSRYRAAGTFSAGLAAVVTGGKLGFIDRTGSFVISPRFPWGPVNLNTRLPHFSEGFCPVPLANGYGYIDTQGEVVLEPRLQQPTASTPFSAMGIAEEAHFHAGLAAIRIRGKTGFIDRDGRLTIPAQFNRVDPFEDGIARVEPKFGYWGCIRPDGAFLWNPLGSSGM